MSLFNICKEKTELVLGSASPRRKELFKIISENFTVLKPDVDETVPENVELYERPGYLAKKKALHISRNLSEKSQKAVVIGCDTGVFIDGEMLGKPKDKEDAFLILKKLRGREHSVITGCCITDGKHTETFSVKSQVFFRNLSDEDIKAYIATGEPMDKAGAYGIQGKGCLLVEKIQGDYFNIVGLPVSALARELSLFLSKR